MAIVLFAAALLLNFTYINGVNGERGGGILEVTDATALAPGAFELHKYALTDVIDIIILGHPPVADVNGPIYWDALAPPDEATIYRLPIAAEAPDHHIPTLSLKFPALVNPINPALADSSDTMNLNDIVGLLVL